MQRTGSKQPGDHQINPKLPLGLRRLREYRLILMPRHSSLAARSSLGTFELSLSEQGLHPFQDHTSPPRQYPNTTSSYRQLSSSLRSSRDTLTEESWKAEQYAARPSL